MTVGWICIDCAEPEQLARWWSQLIGGQATPDSDGDVRLDVQPTPIIFLRVPDPKITKNRMHLDLRVADYDRAVARALELGASPADDVYVGRRWTVMRDPEGNEFCIIRPDPEADDPG